MANTTFSGPVISKNGFIGTGPGSTAALTANTTLTVNDHAGRILITQDADGIFTYHQSIQMLMDQLQVLQTTTI
jgi:hypothetical protein